eukprot:127337-Prymnesium_polylepis.1
MATNLSHLELTATVGGSVSQCRAAAQVRAANGSALTGDGAQPVGARGRRLFLLQVQDVDGGGGGDHARHYRLLLQLRERNGGHSALSSRELGGGGRAARPCSGGSLPRSTAVRLLEYQVRRVTHTRLLPRLWPMADAVAKGGIGSLRAPC